jgi:hypothetical protein
VVQIIYGAGAVSDGSVCFTMCSSETILSMLQSFPVPRLLNRT